MPAPIGIDLGTTFSCVATIGPNEEPVAIANLDGISIAEKTRNFHFYYLGTNTTPSVVAYSDDEILVGKSAVRLPISPKNVIYGSLN